MDAISQLMTLARHYGEAVGCPLSTTSWRVFGDGKKLAAVESGADLQTRRFERAVAWFSDNWPADTTWPECVPRPQARLAAAASTPELEDCAILQASELVE